LKFLRQLLLLQQHQAQLQFVLPASGERVTEGNKRLIIGIQNLQSSYAIHRRGGNVNLVAMLQVNDYNHSI
jgi:transcription antitermination factor NusA-like protein